MKNREQRLSASVLVLGTSAPGLRAAIELVERGVDVLAVGKRPRADTRAFFTADHAGLEMQRTLVNRATQLQIPIRDTIYITRLLVRDRVIFGAYGFDLEDGARYVIYADAVILAAGGHTRIWRHTSSGRDENTGEAFRLAVEAGGRIRDPELVQFHPAGLIEPEAAGGTLVADAAREAGGILRNGLGERFMSRYDPQRMELSTGDRVAAACYTEIQAGRGTENGGVWLDVSHLARETIMQRLPHVYYTLLELQLRDITTTAIEIAPAAHYSIGGVWVRPEDHGTGVEGLYAAGEASSGRHGADRLAGNSLVESLVFGRIVGEAAAAYSARLDAQPRSAAALARARDEIDEMLAADGDESVRPLQCTLRDTMTEHAGVVRDQSGLLAGLTELDAIDARIANVGLHPSVAGFRHLAQAFELKASALAARATLEAALERRETRGCHNRADYPQLDASLEVNFVWAAPGRLEREPMPPLPEDIAALTRDVPADGKPVE